jgi:hypothetical protein
MFFAESKNIFEGEMQKSHLEKFLMTVALEGVGRIHRRQLLWMLGWKYDKPAAWKELIEVWENLDFQTSCLHGTAEGDYIILLSVTGAIDPMTVWAAA